MEVKETLNYLPQNIRYLRKKMEFSQEELAAKSGLKRGNIASYENGTAEPKTCNLLKIAYIFQVPLIDLIEKDLSALNGHYVASNDRPNGYAITASPDNKEIEQHILKAEELQTVVSSLYHCHCFKLKSIDSQDKNVQVLISHFEQLHEVTHNLLKSHQELINLIQQYRSKNTKIEY
jgi:transcriptional regulator with XRE-family HTH domain